VSYLREVAIRGCSQDFNFYRLRAQGVQMERTFPVNLNSIMSLVSDLEKDDAWQLVLALLRLEGFTQAFRIYQ